MAKKKRPTASINTPAKPAGFDPLELTKAWLAKGNQPTQQMIDSGLAAQAGWSPPLTDYAAPAAGDQQASPVDATYLAEEAQRQAKLAADKAQLAQQGAYDRTDLQEALRRMTTAQGRDVEATRIAANKQGLFFSGQLGKRVGDVNTAYAQRQGDAQSDFERREAARQAASAALDQGYTLDQATSLAASADRKVASDQEAALAGYLVPQPSPTQTATAPKLPVTQRKAVTTTGFNKRRNQRFRVERRGGQLFHIYAGGRPVRVG